MARAGILMLVIMGLVAGAAARRSQVSGVFPNFYDALSKTKGANYGKQIVDGLKLQGTLSNPKLALTVFMPDDTAFTTLANKLGMKPDSMGKNTGLMKQVLFYHFVTAASGVKRTFPTAALKPGMKLDTMYISTTTKKAYQLAVADNKGKLQIKSVGTSAYIIKPNIKAGAGVAHIINNVLVPMRLDQIPRF